MSVNNNNNNGGNNAANKPSSTTGRWKYCSHCSHLPIKLM